ncbi:hypothetical protein EJ071_37250 [Mesorhizobium sp. M1B.F.Ca.ET.045.04.1.1]|nr:hypothetical protein EJ071_37250 [Mesorhizobium sp. M1B.F.Ca.ET.045.04.1.1]
MLAFLVDDGVTWLERVGWSLVYGHSRTPYQRGESPTWPGLRTICPFFFLLLHRRPLVATVGGFMAELDQPGSIVLESTDCVHGCLGLFSRVVRQFAGHMDAQDFKDAFGEVTA